MLKHGIILTSLGCVRFNELTPNLSWKSLCMPVLLYPDSTDSGILPYQTSVTDQSRHLTHWQLVYKLPNTSVVTWLSNSFPSYFDSLNQWDHFSFFGVCTGMYVVYVHICMWVCMHVRLCEYMYTFLTLTSGVFLNHSPLYYLKPSLSLNLELTYWLSWWPGGSRDSPVSTLLTQC